jgi:type II secretory pathway component PulF
MKHDEFAFFNQQLAAMLQQGIPLEGAIRQLCAGMKTGALRAECQALEADLARGTPLGEAIARRNLPELYQRMVQLGVRSDDLPGVLLLLADHHQRTNNLWTRLQGLMVYPVLVVLVSLALTLLVSLTISRFLNEFLHIVQYPRPLLSTIMTFSLWLPPLVLGLLAIGLATAFCSRRWRARLRWKLPAFREASLAQLASALALMLRKGTPLPEALALAQSLEAGTPVAKPLATWQHALATGHQQPLPANGSLLPIPPLFLWLVQQSGEDLSSGFQKAADVYQARAKYQTELMLYGALPVSMLLLGLMILWQVAPMANSLAGLMNMIGSE